MPALRAKIVAGAANNQLAHPGIEKLLADRGILYAPDYVVNAGGVIQVADEIQGFNFERAKRGRPGSSTPPGGAAAGRRRGGAPGGRGGPAAERRMADVGRLRTIQLRPGAPGRSFRPGTGPGRRQTGQPAGRRLRRAAPA